MSYNAVLANIPYTQKPADKAKLYIACMENKQTNIHAPSIAIHAYKVKPLITGKVSQVPCMHTYTLFIKIT